MSTKFTIYDSSKVHVYGDVFDSENISLNIVNPSFVEISITNDDLLGIQNQHVNIKINKIDLEKICKEYLIWKNKNDG